MHTNYAHPPIYLSYLIVMCCLEINGRKCLLQLVESIHVEPVARLPTVPVIFKLVRLFESSQQYECLSEIIDSRTFLPIRLFHKCVHLKSIAECSLVNATEILLHNRYTVEYFIQITKETLRYGLKTIVNFKLSGDSTDTLVQ